jgi:hypothetical protein
MPGRQLQMEERSAKLRDRSYPDIERIDVVSMPVTGAPVAGVACEKAP